MNLRESKGDTWEGLGRGKGVGKIMQLYFNFRKIIQKIDGSIIGLSPIFIRMSEITKDSFVNRILP